MVPPASSSLPSPNYERPVSVVSTGIQSDYSPYVQPITQKVPYFSPYWYTHPQVYATKYSAYVPVSEFCSQISTRIRVLKI